MMRAILAEVILGELLADLICGYTNDCVLAVSKSLRSSKSPIPMERSFNAPVGPANGVVDDVLQELLAPLAGGETPHFPVSDSVPHGLPAHATR